MPANNFKPFAIGGGANVISQGAWEALAALSGGFVAGVAQSGQLNKAWRQSSVMAAVLGQFINDYGTLDALDDGNVANLVRDFVRSIQAGKFAYVVATGSANAWVLAPTPSVAAYAAGRPVWVIAPATNTSETVTAAISGLAARPIKKSNGDNPAIGDLLIGRSYLTIDDGTNIRIVSPLRSDVLGWALQPTRVVFATPGSTSWTVPAGVTQAMFSVWSGGGGGGYGWATGGAGAGGSAGAYFQITLPVTPGWSIGVTVGAAGTAGANGVAPGTGGTSSITVNGTTYTALGGPSGTNSNMNAGANSPSPATMPALGDIVRIGGQGSPGISASGAAPIVAGQGGAGYLGGQGGVGGGGIGGAGQAPGGGGGASAVGQAAGAGARGEIVIQH